MALLVVVVDEQELSKALSTGCSLADSCSELPNLVVRDLLFSHLVTDFGGGMDDS